MVKTYKVTYKTYFNERLKQVFFHGGLTYPLYVQVTFDRKTIVFKSYFFELFSKPRYAILLENEIHGPAISDIIEMENALIDYVVERNVPDFSLELFKQDYDFYCTDLCDEAEKGFIDYLYVFFKDEGMPALATTIREGSKFRIAYDIVNDMKIGLKPTLYNKLLENSIYYAPPYLPVYQCMQQIKKWPMRCLTVMEWQDQKIKNLFTKNVQTHFKNMDAAKVAVQVEEWIISLKNKYGKIG